MRSMKLLAAAAVLATLVAGPVMAQDAVSPASEPTAASEQAVKAPVKSHVKKHSVKKHHVKKVHAKKVKASDGVKVGE